MDSLKRKFGDKLEIFIVSREPRAKVEKMLATKPIAQGFKLPFIVEDSCLCKLFPNKYLPHEVIIKDSRVIAVTYPEFISYEAIGSILNGEKLNLPIKNDWINYDYDQSLIKNLCENSVSIGLGEFFLSKSIDGIPEMAYTRKNVSGTFERFTKVNHTLLKLFERAAGFWNANNRIIIMVKDPTKLVANDPTTFEWSKENRYCVEYQYPNKWSKKKASDWLLRQYSTFTGYTLSVENRLVDCWILTKEGVSDPVSIRNYKLKNPANYKTVEAMVQSMNNQMFGSPIVPIVINETNDTSMVNIKINREDIHNPSDVSGVLKLYGYRLTPAKRKLKMLVIKDK
ncbi:hypothetical protein GCM10027566_33160 [Arachidicoccus ginsenosidivorans]